MTIEEQLAVQIKTALEDVLKKRSPTKSEQIAQLLAGLDPFKLNEHLKLELKVSDDLDRPGELMCVMTPITDYGYTILRKMGYTVPEPQQYIIINVIIKE